MSIQPSNPLLSPSPLAFNLSKHQGLFKWVSSSHHVTKVLELQLQHQSFQWIFRTDFLLELTGLISLLSKRLWRVLANITVQKHQFFGAQIYLWSNSHIHTWLLEKPKLWQYGPLYYMNWLLDIKPIALLGWMVRVHNNTINCCIYFVNTL